LCDYPPARANKRPPDRAVRFNRHRSDRGAHDRHRGVCSVGLLVPGFLIVEIAIARGARSSRSDLELALRALVFALVIHLVFIWWTAWLVDRVGATANWHDHVGALMTYVVVVLLAVPVALGLVLNTVLSRVESSDGPPPLWAAALGAGQARDAYDFAFQRVNAEGAWVIVGLYGRGSAVGQTPSPHDIYLEQLCVVSVDAHGLPQIVAKTDPPRGVWVAASQISRIEVLPARTGDREIADEGDTVYA